MTYEIQQHPLIQWMPVLKGIVAGSLVVNGILLPSGIIIQLFLVMIGFCIFIDAVIPKGDMSIVATVFSFILGGVGSVILIASGFGLLWLAAVSVLAIALYMFSLKSKLRLLTLLRRQEESK